MLEVRDLHYSYNVPNLQGTDGTDRTEALCGVSFVLNSQDKLALIGPNGSGKSTLLLALAGCLTGTSGAILLDGQAAAPDQLRETVGFVFQEPDDQLFMPTVLEDVAFGPVAHGVPVRVAQDHARDVLEKLGIKYLMDRVPQRMSGGEKRMTALAGVLVMSPRVIVLDEPTSSLDSKARRRVINVLRELETPMILATHDLDMALDVCSRAMILHDGAIAALGILPEIFCNSDLLERCGLELPLR